MSVSVTKLNWPLQAEERREGEEDSLVVQRDNETGDIITQKTQTIRGPAGSSRTIKTIERIRGGERQVESSVGEAKIMKIEEMMEIQVLN